MASNMQTTKSRWGVSSLLQQAVSGVESRLDVLLANEEDFQKKPLSKEERINQSGSPTPKQVVGCTKFHFYAQRVLTDSHQRFRAAHQMPEQVTVCKNA